MDQVKKSDLLKYAKNEFFAAVLGAKVARRLHATPAAKRQDPKAKVTSLALRLITEGQVTYTSAAAQERPKVEEPEAEATAVEEPGAKVTKAQAAKLKAAEAKAAKAEAAEAKAAVAKAAKAEAAEAKATVAKAAKAEAAAAKATEEA